MSFTNPRDWPVSPRTLAPGTQVGPWRVVERLGEGGYGAVYRVEATARPGEFYAFKLALDARDKRSEREWDLMRREAEHPHVVRVHGSARWPDTEQGARGIVMDWVRGPPLDVWAERESTTFRRLAGAGATVARTLGELHGRGVLHRDLKPEHILMREEDEQPVLLDFGMGWYEGATPLTSGALPPGTPYLRSPESVRFLWENFERPGVHYAFQPTDDLYALGVCLYRAVTGHYPFHGGGLMDLLQHDIVHQEPFAPSDFNHRVPRALNDIILRLLAKKPEARYPDGAALAEALERAATSGELEEWDASILEWEQVTTQKEGEPPHRRPRKPQWPTLPMTPPREALPPERQAQVPPSPEEAKPSPSDAPRPRQAPGRGWLLAGCVVLLGVGWWMASRHIREPNPPVGSTPAPPTSRSVDGQEVAPARPPPDIERAVAPPPAEETPSAVARQTTLAQDDAPVEKPRKTPRAQKDNSKKGPSAKAACWGLVGAALQACTHAPPVPVSTRPPPQECPKDAWKTMEGPLGLWSRARIGIEFPHPGLHKWVPVNEGPVSVRVYEDMGKLELGTFLDGQLFFDGNRLYGRFTRARLASGESLPVCFELWTESKRGVSLRDGMTFSARDVHLVERFE